MNALVDMAYESHIGRYKKAIGYTDERRFGSPFSMRLR